MAARRQLRIAKSLRCYSIAETAEHYGVHRNTVRNWLATGLAAIDGKRPVLINGAVLNMFQAVRQKARQRSCGPDQLYCLGCRQPRRPAGDIADYVPITKLVGSVVAICPVCDRMMIQRVNAARLSRMRIEIAISADRHPNP